MHTAPIGTQRWVSKAHRTGPDAAFLTDNPLADTVRSIEFGLREADHGGGRRDEAVVGRPELILADEPTGNLDTGSGTDVMSLLTELWGQGRTLVVVTHDKTLAQRAGRVVEIRDGLVVTDERAVA